MDRMDRMDREVAYQVTCTKDDPFSYLKFINTDGVFEGKFAAVVHPDSVEENGRMKCPNCNMEWDGE